MGIPHNGGATPHGTFNVFEKRGAAYGNGGFDAIANFGTVLMSSSAKFFALLGGQFVNGSVDGIHTELVGGREDDVRVCVDGSEVGVEPKKEGVRARLSVTGTAVAWGGRGSELGEIHLYLTSQAS